MSYSAWRKSHVSAEQAAEAAYIEARVYEELLHSATKALSQCEHALQYASDFIPPPAEGSCTCPVCEALKSLATLRLALHEMNARADIVSHASCLGAKV